MNLTERKHGYDYAWYRDNCPSCGGQLVQYEKFHDDPKEPPIIIGRACLGCDFIQLDSMGKKVYGFEHTAWDKPVIWSNDEKKFIITSKEKEELS